MGNQSKLHTTQATEAWNAKEAWRMLGIMSEFVTATNRLREIQPAVSIFGSARTPATHPYYKKTEEIARLLSIREPFYRESDVLVNSGLRSLREVAAQVSHHFLAARRPATLP